MRTDDTTTGTEDALTTLGSHATESHDESTEATTESAGVETGEAMKAFDKAVRSAGALVLASETNATRNRWKAGSILLDAVNAYCEATGNTVANAIKYTSAVMAMQVGGSTYAPGTDMRFSVLMDAWATSDDDVKRLQAVPYRVLYKCLECVVEGEADEKAGVYLCHATLPHVADEFRALGEALMADHGPTGKKGLAPARTINDLVAHHRTKCLLELSHRRAAEEHTALFAPLLAKAGIDTHDFTAAVLDENSGPYHDAMVKAGVKALDATEAVNNAKLALAYQQQQRKAADDAAGLKLRIEGKTPPKGNRGAASGGTEEQTEEQKRKTYETQLKALASNATASDLRARDSAVLIGTSVETAKSAFLNLPESVAGDPTFIQEVLSTLLDLKPNTFTAVLLEVLDENPGVKATIARLLLSTTNPVPEAVAKRATSVTTKSPPPKPMTKQERAERRESDLRGIHGDQLDATYPDRVVAGSASVPTIDPWSDYAAQVRDRMLELGVSPADVALPETVEVMQECYAEGKGIDEAARCLTESLA